MDRRLNILDCYFDIRLSELDFENPFFKKLKKGKVKDQEVDSDYAWLFNPVNQTTQPKKDTIYEDKNEHKNKNETEDEDEDVDEDEAEDEDEGEGEGVNMDENNKDPEYLSFLENLTEDGKSYKLKISSNDEEPVFVSYEEALQVGTDNSGDEVTVSEDTPVKPKAKRKANEINGGNEIRIKKEVSGRNKSKDHNPSANKTSFNGPCVKVKSEEEYFDNEEIGATSDSEVVILDNVQDWSEVKDKQPMKNEPSLKEKLMKILKVPYSEKEYKELSDYIEQEKPVLQLKPLREGRFRSNAKAGFNKTVLSHAPHRFRSMLKAAQNDPPKAINLLRMFRFWLEHVPNVDAFQPWTDDDILKVRPRIRRMI